MVELEWQLLDLRYERLRCVEPAREARLTASRSEVGQLVPIMVTGERHVVLDGFKRVRALRGLKRDSVSALPLALSEVEGLLLQQRAQVHRDALEDAWLLLELRTQFGLSEEELARRLLRSKSWVSRRLALCAVLSSEIQALVQRGKLQAYAAAKFLVPLARANPVHAHTLAVAGAARRFSTRQWAELYRMYVASGAAARAYLVAHPDVALKTRSTGEIEPPSLSRDAVVLEKMSTRLLHKVRAFAGVMVERERARLMHTLMQAVEQLGRCIEESKDAGRVHVESHLGAEPTRAGDAGDRADAATEPHQREAVPEDRERVPDGV